MATAGELEERLATIDEAILYVIANGQKRTIRGRSVEYPPLSQMQDQREIIAAEINSARPAKTYFRRRRG